MSVSHAVPDLAVPTSHQLDLHLAVESASADLMASVHLQKAQEHGTIARDRHCRKKGLVVGVVTGPFGVRFIGSEGRTWEGPLEPIRALRREEL